MQKTYQKCRECGSIHCNPNGGGYGVPECCIDSPAYYDHSQYDEGSNWDEEDMETQGFDVPDKW